MTTENNWLSPIKRQSLSKLVVDKIKEGIINGTLKPGDFLPSENELAKKIGVGKSSVREAVKMLEALGVVVISKGNGSKIAESISEEAMSPMIFQLLLLNNKTTHDKLLEFRTMFEISGSLSAIANASDEDLSKIKEIIERTKAELNAKKTTVELDKKFHIAIYASTHNPFILCVGKAIMELFHSSLVISNTKYPQKVIDDHEKIFKYLVKRDKKGIEDSIRESLSRWFQYSLNDQ